MQKEERKARRKLEKNMAKYGWRFLDREILRALRIRLKNKRRKKKKEEEIIKIIIIPNITSVL
jgi:hypothetical protein